MNIEVAAPAFTPVSADHLAELAQRVGDAHVLADADTRATYSHDCTEDLRFPPEVVVRPGTAAEVAAVPALPGGAS